MSQESARIASSPAAQTIAKSGTWSLWRVKGNVSGHGYGKGYRKRTFYDHLEVGEVAFQHVLVSSELERTINPGTTGIYYIAHTKVGWRKKMSILLAFKDRNNEIVAPLRRTLRSLVIGYLLLGAFATLLGSPALIIFHPRPDVDGISVLLFFFVPLILGLFLLFGAVRFRIGAGTIDRALKADLQKLARDTSGELLEGIGALPRSV